MNPVDLVIIGGGPAGMAAATAAARQGASVVLVEEHRNLGGKVLSHAGMHFPGSCAESIEARIRSRMFRAFYRVSDRITVHAGTQAWHIDDRREVYLQPVAGGAAPASVRGRTLVISGGAMERMIPFPGWTLPGVYSAGGLNALVRKDILPGKRFLIAGTGPIQAALAHHLAKKGANIAAVISPVSISRTIPHLNDLISGIGLFKFIAAVNYLFTLQRLRIPVHASFTLVEALGRGTLEKAVIARVDASGRPVPGSRRVLDVDAIGVGYGLIPGTDLTRLLGCRHDYDTSGNYWKVSCNSHQETSMPGVFAAGDGSAIRGYAAAMEEGRIAGLAACAHTGILSRKNADALIRPCAARLKRMNRFGRAMDALSLPGQGMISAIPDHTVVCRCEDVTMADVRTAVANGAADINDLKRRTRMGMGHCQGRFCGQIIHDLMAHVSGTPVARECFTPRIPAKPILFKTLAQERES
jgi:thioredoxin reductase/bacterioferritin-associated ferredoxin